MDETYKALTKGQHVGLKPFIPGWADVQPRLKTDKMIVVNTGTNGGKTTFAWLFARSVVEQGHRCVYFSFETPVSEIVSREFATLADVDTSVIDGGIYYITNSEGVRERRILVPETLSNVREVHNKWMASVTSRFEPYDAVSMSLAEIIAVVKSARARSDIEGIETWVVIDYLQATLYSQFSQDQTAGTNAAANWVKNSIHGELGVGVLVMSQGQDDPMNWMPRFGNDIKNRAQVFIHILRLPAKEDEFAFEFDENGWIFDPQTGSRIPVRDRFGNHRKIAPKGVRNSAYAELHILKAKGAGAIVPIYMPNDRLEISGSFEDMKPKGWGEK
ncbi:MAG: hypothetical protein HC892_00125 [Saprospiraceae bacterium]|nr:hypothetical protein [Saprospiraceae bacterium]